MHGLVGGCSGGGSRGCIVDRFVLIILVILVVLVSHGGIFFCGLKMLARGRDR